MLFSYYKFSVCIEMGIVMLLIFYYEVLNMFLFFFFKVKLILVSVICGDIVWLDKFIYFWMKL